MVKEKKPDLVFLIETKLPSLRMEFIRVRTGFDYMFVVDNMGRSGGLALMWRSELSVEIQNYSRRHINATVQMAVNGQKWKLTGFYGHPDASKRIEAWNLLRHLHTLSLEAWLCVGDFNEIIDDSEKCGARPKPSWQMRNFVNTLVSCQLEDLGHWGARFTWSNMQHDGEFVKERLDRALATNGWREFFPMTLVEVLPNRSSDHTPLFVRFNGARQSNRRKKFRFEAEWNKMESTKTIIRQVWRRKEPRIDPWRIVGRKMEQSRAELQRWVRVNGQPLDDLIKKKSREIAQLQEGEGILDVEKLGHLQQEVHVLLEQEETHLRQRAKTEWLKAGDQNSRFFHACINQRRRANSIQRIMDDTGNIFSTPEDIEGAFLRHFQGLFQTSNPSNVDQCLAHLPRCVTTAMNEELLRIVEEEEILAAVQQMAPLKSPGPDGFPTCFFQDNWEEVGSEVCRAVLGFFETGRLDGNINHTHVALIPKLANPTRVTEYRPISLCNVLYKIVSKVLANRLKIILPEIISSNQSAFIPGHLISDNILVAYETLHSMHSRMWGKEGYMVIKLDMSKAYDRVEWSFLEAVMRRMGFKRRWIALIMECITTVTYSIIVNGQSVGHIHPSRGLRQGDPISPYLFLLCAEVLSSQLQQAERSGLLRGVPTSPRGPRLNHLFFADDSLLFCKATVHDWQVLSGFLELYEGASGQRLNKDKTTIFYSRNTTHEVKLELSRVIGITATQRYDHYLGLPALVGRSRIREFRIISERVKRRVNDWKNKFLSQASKEVLLKAVI
jgi:exonuclease III